MYSSVVRRPLAPDDTVVTKIVDRPVEDGLHSEVVRVLVPGAAFRLVCEAVRFHEVP